jgi:hypothetical protein
VARGFASPWRSISGGERCTLQNAGTVWYGETYSSPRAAPSPRSDIGANAGADGTVVTVCLGTMSSECRMGETSAQSLPK